MIGKMIANRYEIISQIGDGGMSTVYKANDQLLDRFVAVKILKHKHISDRSLVDQFDKEAKAAASIQHPNIVNIFDVGIEGDVHYIVMELVSSQTLKEYIASKETYLKNYQIISIGLQIAEGLSIAHENGIVHRDIKPQNILMTDDHKAKVTDFGIAHAVSKTTTINMSEAIGSVHYASPEQSRGGFVDARTDIYSLGILLYELATGRVPFDGDTPITVALKHLKEKPVPPSALNKTLNLSLEKIILKCLNKAPVERYQTTQDLLLHFKKLSASPNSEINLEAPMLAIQQTQVLPLMDEHHEITGIEDEHIVKGQPVSDKRLIFRAVLTGVGVAALLLFLYSFMQMRQINNTPFEMPNLSQMSVEEASEALDSIGLGLNVESSVVSDYAPDTVVSQSPKPGTEVKRGQTVLVKVSRGKAMQNIVGKTLEEAQKLLFDDGITINVAGEAYSDKAEGVIISQNVAAGSTIDEALGVDVVVSLGKRDTDIVTMPSILNMTADEAQSVLEGSDLIIGDIVDVYSEDISEGIVVAQMIPAGVRVSAESVIDFSVSKGKEVIVTSAESTTESLTASDTESMTESTVAENQTNPQVGQANKRKFFIPLGDDKEIYVIKVTKVDNDEETVLHNQIHRRDEGSVPLVIQATGEVHLRFYKDDEIIRDDVVNFDEE